MVLNTILKQEDTKTFVEYFNFFLQKGFLENGIFRLVLAHLAERKDDTTAIIILQNLLKHKELFLDLDLSSNQYKFLLLCMFKYNTQHHSEKSSTIDIGDQEDLEKIASAISPIMPILKKSITVDKNVIELMENISRMPRDNEDEDWKVV